MSSDFDPASTDSNPYVQLTPNAEPVSESDLAFRTAERVDPIRLRSAVVIVALMWALIKIPGMIAPLTMMHFVSMQGGPVIGAIALSIWWFSSRRVPMRQRLIGFALVFGAVVATLMLSNLSSTVITMVYGIPIALTILVGLLAVFHQTQWPTRRWIAYIGFALFLSTISLFRVKEMDAEFAFSLVPRWTTSEETNLITELDDAGHWHSEDGGGVSMPAQVSANDWAEFRGPNRDGRINGVTFDSDWKSHPPRELWRRAVGPAWSSFCVVGPLIFTQEQRGDREAVTAYRADDGDLLWISTSEGRFEASMGGVGPRATPTFHQGRLYVTTASGSVRCLDATQGESIWEYDFAKQMDVNVPEWGFASSPLIVDDRVVVFAGGNENRGLIALNKNNGDVLWTGGDGSHSYCSPQLSTIDGVRQILYATSNGLQSLEIIDGSTMWKHEWDLQGMPRVVQPCVIGNTVYLETGYGNGTRRLDVNKTDEGWQVEDDWTVSMKPYFNDSVFHDGNLYGFDSAIMMSIDGETGKKNWKGGRYGHGQLLLIEDMSTLLVLGEQGQVALVKAEPSGFEEIASMQALEGLTWNHPVIADGKLYVRNATEAVCYELPGYQQSNQHAEK